MRSGVSVFLSVGLTSGLLSAGAFLASCGGDDVTATAPTEGGADGTTDSNLSEASGDSTTDTGPSPDGGPEGAVDGPGPSDSGPGTEGGMDSACPMAVPSQANFVPALAQVVCQRLQTCCLLTASQFDMATCLSTFSDPSFGGWLGTGYAEPYFEAGRIAYDMAEACQCLVANANLNCGALTAQETTAIQNTCFAAIPGTVTQDGGACSSSYECAPSTSYCRTTDAGSGCLPLVADGGGCTTDDQCSYLTNGAPLLYCDTSRSVCAARLPDNSMCSRNAECASNTCTFIGGSTSCQSAGTFSDPGTPGGVCDAFTLRDAGGG
jgi:hypothetical protein